MHNVNVIPCHNLNGKCIAHGISYNLHIFEMKVEHDSQHVMGLGVIVSWSKCQEWKQNTDDLCHHSQFEYL
jgi:hypothetical protein